MSELSVPATAPDNGLRGAAAIRRERRSLVGIGAAIVVAAAFLAIGSVHPTASSDGARISYLESVLKCPSCDDLSIGQSKDNVALRLDEIVVADVHDGKSDSAIESYVLGQFPNAILVPRGGLGALVFALPLAAIVLAVVPITILFLRRRAVRTDLTDPDDEAIVDAALARNRG